MSAWLRCRAPLDWLAALVLAVVAAPVLIVLGAVTWLVDGRPAFVRLPRVGRDGRPFAIWKLRTMRVALSPAEAGPPITRAGDDRVTRWGRRLRRFHLDELPQLLNVLSGDMALVGPRPETPEYVDLEDPRWQAVLRARPGVAGPTQVMVQWWEAEAVVDSGDEAHDVYGDEILPVKLAIDRWYVERATPVIDLWVAASLVRQVLSGPSETALHARVRQAVSEASRIPALNSMATVPESVHGIRL